MDISKLTIPEIESQLSEIEQAIKNENNVYFSFNNDLEKLLFEYYGEIQDYRIYSVPIHRIYYELALKYKEQHQVDKVIDLLEKSLKYNPADIDVLIELATIYYKSNNLKEMIKIINKMYPYIYTRKDLAYYYCLLGCYYLNSYKPDLAEALYMYSNIFYRTKQAQIDLKFIEEAVGRKKVGFTKEELKEFLKEQHINLTPKHETLCILYYAYKMAEEQNNTEYASQLLLALYQFKDDKFYD